MPYSDVLPAGECAESVHLVRWLGKPSPVRWAPADGFTSMQDSLRGITGPPVPGIMWAPTYLAPRCLTLTTCFIHPQDRGQLDVSTVARFKEDGKHFPVTHYYRHSIVQKDKKWRTLCANECEILMGFPIGTQPICVQMTQTAQVQEGVVKIGAVQR